MGDIRQIPPALLIVAVSSRYDDALEWAEQACTAEYGALIAKSEAFAFTETSYYESTMGTQLKKQFLAFEKLIDPAVLPSIKRRTNQMEAEYAESVAVPEVRPLNLDPGYICESKLILASTKDHSHRIYLHDGIFAEITLQFKAKRWQLLPWTYPDYQRADFHDFFMYCRRSLRMKLQPPETF